MGGLRMKKAENSYGTCRRHADDRDEWLWRGQK